jgi:hypothetical protein
LCSPTAPGPHLASEVAAAAPLSKAVKSDPTHAGKYWIRTLSSPTERSQSDAGALAEDDLTTADVTVTEFREGLELANTPHPTSSRQSPTA